MVTKDYEQMVRGELTALAAWLDRNAGNLARTFSDGCQSWSVEFESDFESYGDGVPRIHIRTDKVDRETTEVALGIGGDADD